MHAPVARPSGVRRTGKIGRQDRTPAQTQPNPTQRKPNATPINLPDHILTE
ncbi:predicted protein [Plenodomus lingam JN3]|uniref:Predicted protein n=1 Tax=Leptosphaeria maculans (strain JN3 / isolate v23.1.3 / race Av1-4-5-6-7-8) TaxID=985895 RepID=E5A1W5_LEPMJ|nr:predicted protein [Plenodomus lingam JN3]CBX97682.1 predicted protein [Plenodomus lingam JN3]